jgi:hypothetical protein
MGMKISIDGYLFDTEKAKKHYNLGLWDDRSNFHSGEVYLSSKDIWYIYTPSQWANMHYWDILGKGKAGAKTLLQEYSGYLSEEEIDEIAKEFEVEFE